jgi:uncharacterized protein (TIGR02118 family)
MRKRFGLIKRRADLSRAEMQHYWRNVHGPLVAGVENYWNFTERYIQNHPLEIETDRVPLPQYDGVMETWQRERANPDLLFADTPEYRQIMLPDEFNFLDRSACISMVAEANPILEGPREGIKLLSFIKRRPDITQEQFVHHWRDIHAPLIEGPGGVASFFVRYVQHYVVPGTEKCIDGSPSPHGFSGVLELWFRSIEDMIACFESSGYLDRLKPDEVNFAIQGSVRFLLKEVEFTSAKRAA